MFAQVGLVVVVLGHQGGGQETWTQLLDRQTGVRRSPDGEGR